MSSIFLPWILAIKPRQVAIAFCGGKMSGDVVSTTERASSPERATFRRIADTVGVPIAASVCPAEPPALHAGMNEACRLLARDGQGTPVFVRHFTGPEDGDCVMEQRVPAFLAGGDPGAPQHRALAALIDERIAAHRAS